MTTPTYRELNDAWWKWVNENCPSRSSRARGRWMHANTFTYRGVVYTRSRETMAPNTGKSIVYERNVFQGGGETISDHDAPAVPNRRNDPERNWGLPE